MFWKKFKFFIFGKLKFIEKDKNLNLKGTRNVRALIHYEGSKKEDSSVSFFSKSTPIENSRHIKSTLKKSINQIPKKSVFCSKCSVLTSQLVH